jgi:Ion channel
VFIAILITAGTVVGSVYVHLGALLLLWWSYPRLVSVKRHFVGVMVLGVFVAHFLEIALFTAAMIAIAELGADDTPGGGLDSGRFDALYHSAAFYTTTGGSPLPTTPLRLLSVAETLTGVILIAWTASFLFMVMKKHWEEQGDRKIGRLPSAEVALPR